MSFAGSATAPRADSEPFGVIPFSLVEEYYKRPGGTLLRKFTGVDPFDFWFGRFYVGFFGVLSITFAVLGTIFYIYAGLILPRTLNIIAAKIEAPLPSAGLRFVNPAEQGFYWQLIVIVSTLAFLFWGLREVDICRKLKIGYEIPITFFCVFSSWVTLQIARPFAMGAWSNGFTLGITAHLDWVSNIGYQYFNFFYNPFHALGVSLLFGSTMVLAMHGSAIKSVMNRPWADARNLDSFWRGILGYSIGEIGIHRLAFWLAAAAVLISNLCIFLSGTLVQSWTAFWSFWDRIPVWAFGGLGALLVPRRRRGEPAYEAVDIDEVERGGRGLEGYLGREQYVPFVDKIFGNGIFGKIYLGPWGILSTGFFLICVFIILTQYLAQVNYNPLLFVREFAVLGVNPPAASYGLRIAPWTQGGAWQVATFFLYLSVLCWWARIYFRAKQTGVGRDLFRAFSAALLLFFTIYLFRPLLLGAWNEAPGHGLKVHLDWVNDVSVRYGNFYYNPFHMLSIFFLLGSTMVLGMHGATIVATAKYGSELEVREMTVEGTGTHRGQLFWRWTMGFNANAASIHFWCYWLAIGCVVAGAIGLLLSGPVIRDWYAWAIDARIVIP